VIQSWKSRRPALIRTVLGDERWARIEGELPGKKGDPGCTARDNRLFVESVLWVARTGSPWRDLPGESGNWLTVYTRFWRWAKKGVWERVFKALSDDPDFEYVMIDGTICRVHQHGAGAKGGLKIRPSGVRGAG
jgi:putative transposase